MKEIPEGQWKIVQDLLIRAAASGKDLMEFLQGEIIEDQRREITALRTKVAELEADKVLDAKAREQLKSRLEGEIGPLPN